MSWLATFYTHLAALRSQRSLTRAGIDARLAPVPRALSSSCGTCVLYESEEPRRELLDRDTEGLYRQSEAGYETVFQNEIL